MSNNNDFILEKLKKAYEKQGRKLELRDKIAVVTYLALMNMKVDEEEELEKMKFIKDINSYIYERGEKKKNSDLEIKK